MKFITRSLPLLAFVPMLAFAQGEFTELSTFLGNIVEFTNDVLVPLLFVVAFLVFIWGVFQYFILGGDDEGKRETGKGFMVYGIVGFVVMVSVWGIVNLFSSGLGLKDANIEDMPTVDLTR